MIVLWTAARNSQFYLLSAQVPDEYKRADKVIDMSSRTVMMSAISNDFKVLICYLHCSQLTSASGGVFDHCLQLTLTFRIVVCASSYGEFRSSLI